ncbi:flagellar basal body L-ring protein FlgH [Lysobacter antibioticus]|uniref:flagellar basal body L-ring protein FlgH n=1 Tax=Lysobacter antibioticus TaxID=84531 RepID=UPI0009E96CB7|nr:flagellar basal body L-ring protein FlgH [Lysobacter antibioticus]
MSTQADTRHASIPALLMVVALCAGPVKARSPAAPPLPPPPPEPSGVVLEAPPMPMAPPPASSLPLKGPIDVNDYVGHPAVHPTHHVGDAVRVFALKSTWTKPPAASSPQAVPSDLLTIIPAEVVAVKPDGSVRIQGLLTLDVSGKQQTYRVSGLVRREDLDIDNAVVSNRIADAGLELVDDGGMDPSRRQRSIENMYKFLSLQRAR